MPIQSCHCVSEFVPGRCNKWVWLSRTPSAPRPSVACRTAESCGTAKSPRRLSGGSGTGGRIWNYTGQEYDKIQWWSLIQSFRFHFPSNWRCACNFHKASLLQEWVTTRPCRYCESKASISNKDSSFGETIIYEIRVCWSWEGFSQKQFTNWASSLRVSESEVPFLKLVLVDAVKAVDGR